VRAHDEAGVSDERSRMAEALEQAPPQHQRALHDLPMTMRVAHPSHALRVAVRVAVRHIPWWCTW
jgi:hypothetical protein